MSRGFAQPALGERLPLRRNQHNPCAARSTFWPREFLDPIHQWFGLHQHARPAPVGAVVNGAVTVRGPVSQVVGFDSREPALPRHANKGLGQEVVEQARKDRENIDF